MKRTILVTCVVLGIAFAVIAPAAVLLTIGATDFPACDCVDCVCDPCTCAELGD